ncbi:MAG: phosphotransferase [Myxococcota bacterium]
MPSSERKSQLRHGALDALRRGWAIIPDEVRCVRDRWNAVFCVTLGSQRYGLRLASPDYHPVPAVRGELRFLDLLPSALLCPRPMPTRTGDVLLTAPFGELEHTSAILYPWLEGRKPVSNERLFSELGQTTRILHDAARSVPPGVSETRPHWTSDRLRRYWFAPHDARAWQGLDAVPTARFSEAFERLADFEASAPAPVLIHADLHLGNLLWVGQRLAVLDFDDCGLASPLYDLAVPLASKRHSVTSSAADTLLQGYADTVDRRALGVHLAARSAAAALFVRGWALTHTEFRPRVERDIAEASSFVAKTLHEIDTGRVG